MKLEGGCYCGGLRYEAEGDPLFKGLCYCRECQYITGGDANVVMAVPEGGFRYTQGSAKEFTRKDLDNPVTRQFCPECGTHVGTRVPGMPALILKVGTLDDPAAFGTPDMAIFLCDKQSYHRVPEGIPALSRGPGSDPA